MELLLAILPILGALVPFVLKEISARQARAADPKTKNENAYAQINREILSQDSARLTAGSAARLDELERLLRAQGSGGQR